jgi:hypothetical protein
MEKTRNNMKVMRPIVSLLGQTPRLCQVGNQGLHLIEWHLVQLITISELESTQSQSRDCAEQRSNRLSTSTLSSW